MKVLHYVVFCLSLDKIPSHEFVYNTKLSLWICLFADKLRDFGAKMPSFDTRWKCLSVTNNSGNKKRERRLYKGDPVYIVKRGFF